MNTSEVLNRAADHIQEFGHWKGDGFGPGSPFTAPACIYGALGVASAHSRDSQRAAEYAVYAYLPGGIVDFNDAPDRTAAEVIETLRACAVIEAARESEREPVSA